MDLLNGAPIVELSGDEFLPKEGITFAQQVNEYFISQGGKANSTFGEVLLDIKGIQNSKQHGMSRIKAAAFTAVKDVLEKGIEILPMDYHGVHDKKQMTGMIAAPIVIGVEKYICVVEVIANLKVNRLYVHEAFVIKTLFEDAASNLVHGSETTSPHPQGEIAKVLQNYLCANKNLNENLQEIVATSPVHDNNIITSRQPQGEVAKVLQNYICTNKNLNENLHEDVADSNAVHSKKNKGSGTDCFANALAPIPKPKSTAKVTKN